MRAFVSLVVVLFGCAGAGATPRPVVCPSPPPATSHAANSDATPVEKEAKPSAEDELAANWIRDERKKLLAELEALDDSIRLVPLPVPVPTWTNAPGSLLVDTKSTLDFLRQAKVEDLATDDPRDTLGEIARRALEAEQAAIMLSATYGPAHPRMLEARARVDFFRAWVDCQKRAEVDALESLAAALEGYRPGRRPEPDAVERIVVETVVRRLRIPLAEQRCFANNTPVSLQIEGADLRRLELERDLLGKTLGPGHPRMMDIERRIADASQHLERWRETKADVLELRLRELDLAARSGRRAQQRGEFDVRVEQRLDARERLIGAIIALEKKERDLALPKEERPPGASATPGANATPAASTPP